MDITEVRIKLMESAEDRLRGFCSVTFDDCFVVRDLKIIEGKNGPFVAMPSRKLTSNCYKCRTKNHLRANYCNNCGNRLKSEVIAHDQGGRAKLYADIAHPVNATCREMIQKRVVEELDKELELAAQPGYSSRYDDEYHDDPLAMPDRPRKGERDKRRNKDAGTAAQSPQNSKSETDSDIPANRVDSSETQPTPHKPNPDVSSGRSKPALEDFGKGIFD
ncbi:MAG: septation protein SpoVG family protein [Mariniblastus sp.]